MIPLEKSHADPFVDFFNCRWDPLSILVYTPIIHLVSPHSLGSPCLSLMKEISDRLQAGGTVRDPLGVLFRLHFRLRPYVPVLTALTRCVFIALFIGSRIIIVAFRARTVSESIQTLLFQCCAVIRGTY